MSEKYRFQSCRLVMAQINPLVGDIQGNQSKIQNAIIEARDQQGADVIVFSELVICGYPPEDLLHRPAFIESCERAIQEIAAFCHDITAVIGAPVRFEDELFNAAAIIQNGAIVETACKQRLPNYGVFDEQRYFSAGKDTATLEIAPGLKAGITICEDIWSTQPVASAVGQGADLIINLNASPFHEGKHEQRTETLMNRIQESGLPIVYVNQVGGQDELVFDGASMVLDHMAEPCVQAPVFQESIQLVDIQLKAGKLQFNGDRAMIPENLALIYEALVYGVRDYVNKNGFSGAVLGLSGGIDSALTLAIAVDALGAERVSAVMMPSQYTADMSLEDAKKEADSLGVEYHVIPISPAFEAFNGMLKDVFRNEGRDVTEENLQARSRGVLLMAISNKQGKIVLTTGNKSEMAVGYATLYGDMAGGFAPLKDIYKMLVYQLSEYRNSVSQVIPQRVISRAPSAELAPDQVDQDSLPPYDVLDEILKRYIENNECAETIIKAGYRKDDVNDTIRRVDFNEYKRRQAPPGIKMTDRAFGRDRRYPITSKK